MIREIKTDDALAIQTIARDALGYDTSIEVIINQINSLKNTPHHFIRVFEDVNRGQVVGFVQAEHYESIYSEAGLNILGLAVLTDYEKQGIGKALMQSVEKYAIDHHFTYIRLNSAVKRTEAHKFYQHIGYESDKEQKRFIKQFK